LNTSWEFEDIHNKRIFAEFTTSSGQSYDGVGRIRARQNPAGELAIEFVFTHKDSPTQLTDIIFNVSSRQIRHLIKTDHADYDFAYKGRLSPDIQPDDP
jgi:hypothetical protein